MQKLNESAVDQLSPMRPLHRRSRHQRGYNLIDNADETNSISYDN